MTAVEHETDDLDAPIPFTLSERGWAIHRGRWLTTGEAAERLGVCGGQVVEQLRTGRLIGVRVERNQWLVDAESVGAVASLRRRLPAEPLLRLVAGRGGPSAVGARQHSAEEKALERAARDGWVTVREADALAVGLLGLTPWEVWGAEYDA